MGGVCSDCVDTMPPNIANIRAMTDAELVHRLNMVCDKDNNVKAYCKACKNMLLIQKSNIKLYSKSSFDREARRVSESSSE